MKSLRIALHSLTLTLVDLAGVLFGFVVFKLLGSSEQLLIQVPAAIAVTTLLFIGWNLLFRAPLLKKWRLPSYSEFLGVFACSLAWNPLVFVPLHYFTQGYLTSMGNIVGLLLYQLPVNALAVSVAWACRRRETQVAVAEPAATFEDPC